MLKSAMNLDRNRKLSSAPEDIKDEKKNAGNVMESVLKQHTM